MIENIVLVRCENCAYHKTARGCAVLCALDAITEVAGDILIDVIKCEGCGKNKPAGASPIPDCVRLCDGADSHNLRCIPIAQKRFLAAEHLAF